LNEVEDAHAEGRDSGIEVLFKGSDKDKGNPQLVASLPLWIVVGWQ
jgi:hypothetical protein